MRNNRQRKENPVLRKWVVAYTTLIILVTLLLSGITTTLFSISYNQAVYDLDGKFLERVGTAINAEIFNAAQSLAYSMIYSSSSPNVTKPFQESQKSDEVDLYRAYMDLKKVLGANEKWLADIEFYYKEKDVLLSAATGLRDLTTYPQDSTLPAYCRALDNLAVRQDFFQVGELPDIRENPQMGTGVGMVFLLPYQRSADKGFLALKIREDAVRQLVQRVSYQQNTNLWLSSPGGYIMPLLEDGKVSPGIRAELTAETREGAQADGHFWDRSTNQIVSYHTLSASQYRLVKLEPVQQFYSRMLHNVLCLLGVGLLTLLAGCLMAFLLSRRFYVPLQALVSELKARFSRSPVVSDGNDYEYIGSVIHHVALEKEEFDQMLEANRAQIQNNFVVSVLNNTMESEYQRKEIAELLHLSVSYPHYAAILIQAYEPKGANASPQSVVQYVKYRVKQLVQEEPQKELMLLAGEMEEHQIGILAGYTEAGIPDLCMRLSSKINDAVKTYGIQQVLSLGEGRDRLENVHLSTRQARVALKYHFFLPAASVLNAADFLPREKSKERPLSLQQRLSLAINRQALEEINELMSEFLDLCGHGNYSAEVCHHVLLNFLYQLTSYGKTVGFDPKSEADGRFYITTNDMENIICFQSWYLEYCGTVFAYAKERLKSKNGAQIDDVKQFIRKNLHEDISLETAAKAVGLTPGYLSKIFKAETNENFVEYLNRQRMEQAAQLLAQTADTVTAIAEKTGFRSTPYFNRKFKELYGEPPLSYRKRHSPLK